jgi:PKHD-type hydroxylase
MAPLVKTDLNVELLSPDTVDSGGGAWPILTNRQEDWAWRKDAFAPHELDSIIRMADAVEFNKGRTGADTGRKQDTETRNSDVKFIFPNGLTSWVFQRLTAVVEVSNSQFFNFDLSGFEQGLQLTRYSSEGEQHYDWHVDRGMETGNRKLSLTLQLSDPKDYEGGDLELKFGKENIVASRERGMMTLFPSFVLHRVTPVTKGTRYSLVAWVSGPPFK